MQNNALPNTAVALVSIARPTFDVPLAQSVADEALRQLTAAGFQVVGTGAELLMDEAGGQKAVAALRQTEFDLLILLQASFADSSMAVQIAQALQAKGAPTLLWAVPDERSGGRLRLNSLCGINLAGHALTQRQIPYEYVFAPATDTQALRKISVLLRAARARRALQQTRLGLVGQHPAGFDTCAYHAQNLAHLFGVHVEPLSLEQTLQAARAASPAARAEFLAKASAQADNLGELDQTALTGTAGVYCALRQAAADHRLDGMAVRCWPEFFTELGCAACGAMSMLSNEQVAASCEADINGTLTLVLLQHLSAQPTFITDLVSIEAESDTGVLWHCGLAPFSMADPEGEIAGALHSNRKLPLLFEFTLKPGRITLARLNRTAQADVAEEYRLVIGGGEMQRAPKSFGGTSGVVRFDQPALTVLDRVMREGLEHHFCIVYGDYRDELHTFARLVGLPVLELC
ncbi:MAG: hypothetical protein R3A44_12495 [Caldilineaceae bacterium]